MRITLVQPPSNHEETFLLSPPLGLLSIAAAAENEGAEVSLLDFNLKGLQDQRWQTAEYFYPNAFELVRAQKPDIVGFTSMGIESHVCLELAKQLKENNPAIITVLGGPHFGAIATEVLESYEWIDYVIAGEGEAPLQNLLRLLQDNDQILDLDNIARRTDAGITFKRRSLAGRDLDELPLPAYHLVDMDEYFALNPSKLVCFEHARGCYLKCSFCYSPQHWGHGESRKSIERILAELRQLESMGIKELFWVSDNLLNSKDHAITVSEAIEQSGMRFKWHCYGTMPQITEPVVKALSAVGCQSIFVGVDAVAEDTKKNYKKSYFKGWDSLRAKLRMCLEHNIRPTCAFMLSPYDKDDTRETTLRIAALCANLGCFVRLNALTYYNQSEILRNAPEQANSEYSEAYAKVLFDTAEILNENEFAKIRPTLFPFHRTFIEKEKHEFFAGYARVAMQIANNHTGLAVLAAFEHNILLHTLIGLIRGSFFIDEITCRGLADASTRLKFSCTLYRTCVRLELPADVIDFDLFSHDLSNRGAPRTVSLKVDGKNMACFVTETCLLSTRLDPRDLETGPKAKLGHFLYGKRSGRVTAVRVNEETGNFLHANRNIDNCVLSVNEYVRLVQHSILIPALL